MTTMTNQLDPCTGRISASAEGKITAAADCCDTLPLFCPSGLRCFPEEGEQGFLIPFGGGYALLGTAASTQGLEPGELILESGGGAYIHLKNTGDVVINGLAIQPDGTVVPPQKEEP